MIARSSSRQQQQTSTQNENKNLNLQDTEGVTVANESGNVNIIQTDQNAFDKATQLAQQSVSVADEIAKGHIDLTRDLLGGVSDFFARSLDFVGSTVQAEQQGLNETVSALNAISKQQNTSTDQRVADVSAQGQRTMLYAVGILAAAAVAFAIFKGR